MGKALITIYLLLFGVSMYAQTSPNILLVIADDMGIDVTPGFGIVSEKPITPTLDSLRSTGITFTNCWATPQCTPTRAAIISGLYGIKTGVMDPPGPLDPSYTSLFHRAKNAQLNYAMAVIGKWHLTGGNNLDHPMEHGVDHYEGMFSSGVEDYYQWTKVTNGKTSIIQEYATSHITDRSIDWVRQQDQPWLLWLAHAAPHSPLQAPPAALHTTEITDNQSTYFAMIEAMDHEINRLLQSLDQETRNNTIVLFIGDNGTSNNVANFFPRGHNKGSIYEGGLRVPLIISGAGVDRQGVVDHSLVHATDLNMTILDLMSPGISEGDNNSKSLVPLLTNEQSDFRDINYSDYDDDGILYWATRTSRYKLIENELGVQEFYDLDADLEETNDLINNLTSEQASIVEALQNEAAIRRAGWSCQDGILNGEELTIDDCGTILGSHEPSKVKIYPNPLLGKIQIYFPNPRTYHVKIYKLTGQLLINETACNGNKSYALQEGIYLVRVNEEGSFYETVLKAVVKNQE